MLRRKCRHCGGEYEYEGCANLIAFCPHCRKYDYMECEYGFVPVAPCTVYLGSGKIAEVTNDDRTELLYRYDSEKFNVHIVLKATYLKALEEARDITSELLEKN